METSSLAQVTDLVKAFTPQQDGVRVRKCEIAQKMLKISTGKSFQSVYADDITQASKNLPFRPVFLTNCI